MISILEYAIISGHIYAAHKNNYFGINFFSTSIYDIKRENLPNGWHFIDDLDPSTQPLNDFYAGLYLKLNNGKATDAVIAFRGTVMTNRDNILTDVWSWYSAVIGNNWHEHPPHYLAAAAQYTYIAEQYVQQHFPEISLGAMRFTGHSLGGALAQLLAISKLHPTVVFNSPSCRGLMRTSIEKQWSLIYNINSRYGIINKIGGYPVGNLYVIDIPQMEIEAKSLFAHFNTAEFTQGERFEQVAEHSPLAHDTILDQSLENAIGFRMKVEALIGATQGFSELPREHLKIVECEGSEDYHSLTSVIHTLTQDTSCNVGVTFSSLEETIAAQHSIDNLIRALQTTPKIANTVV